MKTQYINDSPVQVVPKISVNLVKTWRPLRAALVKWYIKFAPLLAVIAIIVLTMSTNLGAWITVGTVFFTLALLIRTNQELSLIHI